MTDYPKNLSPEEATFWMQVYLAFVPRTLEKPGYQNVETLETHYLTPAEVADTAIIELRKRYDYRNHMPIG